MILVANLVPSASFCDERKAIFFKIALGRMLLSCRVNICSARSFQTFRSNHLRVLENFVNFTGKHLRWSLYLIKPEHLQLY